jgi:hypothetical protein
MRDVLNIIDINALIIIGSTKYRNQIQLQKSYLKKGKSSKGENFIHIEPVEGGDTIMVLF